MRRLTIRRSVLAGRPDDAVIAGDASQVKTTADNANANERMTVNLEDSTQMANLKEAGCFG